MINIKRKCMKKIILLCFLFPSIYFSQNIRFIYNYQFVSDTLKKTMASNEIVVLDFYGEKKQSVFTGLKHLISDSTMAKNSKKGIMTFPDPSMKIKYVIEKTNNGDSLYFYTPNHMPDPVLKVKDDRKMEWEITNERKEILGYTALKAITFFAGRQWIAWFTEEIPIPDGPYKFHGLPGLILNISDSTNTHSFKIISVQKQNSNYLVLNDDTYKETKPISLKEYEKMPHNPYILLKNKALMGEVHFRNNEEKQKFMKNIEVQIKESKIHDNNPIEINLLK